MGGVLRYTTLGRWTVAYLALGCAQLIDRGLRDAAAWPLRALGL
jgi:hypothetical protein